MGYVIHSDIPQNELCATANFALWEIFVNDFRNKYHYPPSARMWTEENVIQWYDRFLGEVEASESVDYAD